MIDVLLILLALGISVLFSVHATRWREVFGKLARSPSAPPAPVQVGGITVLVPARNAADTIVPLLQDLYAQDLPKERAEVIVVDDGSEDDTSARVEGMRARWPQLKLLKAIGVGKKAAITTGVEAADNDIIVVTDADARCGPGRLSAIAGHWTDRTAMMLMPVATDSDGSLIGALQENEQAALAVVTFAEAAEGRPILANGANMAFSRSAFRRVGGYQGDPFTSGDDVLLVQRMHAEGLLVDHLLQLDVLVRVEAVKGLKAFLQQRLRWAGKMRGVQGHGKWVSAVALLHPWFLLALTVCTDWTDTIGHGFVHKSLFLLLAWLLWLHPIPGLVRQVKGFLGQRHSTAGALMSFLAFTLYAPLIALLSPLLPTTWKGRPIQ